MKKLGLKLDHKLKDLMVGKNCFIKNHATIGINTDDDDLNKLLKFPTPAIIIWCVFQEVETFYPKIYLDEYFYEL